MGNPRPARAFVPDSFAVPLELVTEDFGLEPLGPQHNAGDYEAWTSSIDHTSADPWCSTGGHARHRLEIVNGECRPSA